MEPKIILFSVFLIIGIVLTIYGVFNLISTRKFIKNSIKTTGKVIDNKTMSGNMPAKTRYSPIIEFNINNKKIKFNSKVWSIKKYEINSEILILYNKNNPQEAEIAKNMNLITYTPLIGGIFSLVVGIIGILK